MLRNIKLESDIKRSDVSDIEAERPSRPSMKLYAFIIRTVKGMDSQNGYICGKIKEAHTAQISWKQSFHSGERSKKSSAAPKRSDNPPAHRSAESSVCNPPPPTDFRAIDVKKAREKATPPSRGTGDV